MSYDDLCRQELLCDGMPKDVRKPNGTLVRYECQKCHRDFGRYPSGLTHQELERALARGERFIGEGK